MADFCYHCYPLMFGGAPGTAEQNDMADPNMSKDSARPAVCEGCGPGMFDYLGRKVVDENGKLIKVEED